MVKVHDTACTERQNEKSKIREYKREYLLETVHQEVSREILGGLISNSELF